MARRPLEVLEAASNEALEAAEWYRERSEDVALAFVAEIRDALARIEEAPETWPPHHHGTQRKLLNRFPYEVVYRLSSDRILIVAIAHCKRRPAYWRRR